MSARDGGAGSPLALAMAPDTVGDALTQLARLHEAYDNALAALRDAQNSKRVLADRSGRERRRCAGVIAEAHRTEYESGNRDTAHALKGDGSYKPIAQETLDKQAGDHPDYVRLRLELVQMEQQETDAQALVNAARERVATARMIADHQLAAAADESRWRALARATVLTP